MLEKYHRKRFLFITTFLLMRKRHIFGKIVDVKIKNSADYQFPFLIIFLISLYYLIFR